MACRKEAIRSYYVNLTSPGKDVIGVVLLALLVNSRANAQDGGSGHPVRGKAALGLGLTY